MAGLGLVLLVSLTVLVASVAVIATRSAAARPSTPPAPSFSPSLSSPATSEVVEDGLQAGDRYRDSRMLIAAFRVTQRHRSDLPA